MNRAKIIKDEIFEENRRFFAIFIETRNACLVLLSEAEDNLGTLVVAIPPEKGLIGPFASSTLLGTRHSTIAKILAEKIASKKGKIALVSIHLKTLQETEAGPILVRLVEKIMEQRENLTEREVEGAPA